MNRLLLIILPLITLLLSGCLGTRYLEDNEKLLVKNKIKGDVNIPNSDLEPVIIQKPNKKLPIVPFAIYVWFYETGERYYDVEEIRNDRQELINKFDRKITQAEKEKRKNKLQNKKRKKVAKIDKKLEEGNLLMRWGEPLSIFDSTLANSSAKAIEQLLINKGYFKAEVKYSVDTTSNSKKVVATYNLEPGEQYMIRNIEYDIQDSTLSEMLKNQNEITRIKTGIPYDQSILIEKRNSIDSYLKNHGYFNFNREYVRATVRKFDSLKVVDIKVNILNPEGKSSHSLYKIDSVTMVTDSDVKDVEGTRQNIYYRGISYKYFEKTYSQKVLTSRIFVKPDQLYSRENIFDTQRQLGTLDMFRTINITYDTTGGNIDVFIAVTPLKKFQMANEFGLGINISQGVPGPFYNLTLKNRNTFGGLEILQLNARIGFERVATENERIDLDFYNNNEYGANLSLTFPQFLLPLGEDRKTRMGKLNPTTKVLTGYNFVSTPEYQRENVNSYISYQWFKNQKNYYNLTPLEVYLIDSEIKDALFLERLKELEAQGNSLIRSFDPSFVSATYFTFTKNINQYGQGSDNNSAYFRILLEHGGLIPEFNSRLTFFKYDKLSFDFRRLRVFDERTQLAYKIKAGVAVPYGSGNDILAPLPYEKYFFTGGSNSIRAWRSKRLGPGDYQPLFFVNDSDSLVYDDRFEQPGEILLEASIEFRQNLAGFIDIAFFIDAGNVWRLKDVNLNPEGGANTSNGKFEFRNFYKEIAVGSGAGLRLDFSYIVVRFDVGVKIHDPGRAQGKRFIWDPGFNDYPYNTRAADPYVLNIGVGYPF
ncbi:translocation and assembly module lipoprotein TamL [Marinigracilibium pacificum]|uniref:BamA/TamA family outer membrane protein n=1 Tax=Marinigracilibium pacificum TaxID=2729599 RepID=A0A848J412_9BACT|nr:BamA/TamA family outer membrane protein [Marinigracilibium pacificum]NMM50456.1 BamA/TamA family outer membrane protein [Marinigracilibium pacificum]